MNAQLLVAILGTSGLTAIVAAIINGLFAKRKLGADATKIITEAASGVVADLQRDLDRRGRELAAERREASAARKELAVERRAIAAERAGFAEERREWSRERAAWTKLLREWGAWEAEVVERLEADTGLHLPDAPPIRPPDLVI